jgi:peptidoglycan-associated lipoprotein
MIEFVVIFLLSVGAILASGEQEDIVVLLAEDDGSVGKVVVTSNGGSQILDQKGLSTTVSDADQAPSAPVILAATEIEELFGEALAAQPPKPLYFRLFFETGTAVLDADSQSRLPDVISAAQNRKYAKISVIGHTDRSGGSEINERIALQRAEEIRNLLIEEGLPENAVTARSHGEHDNFIPTEDGVREAQNRRVEINIR